MRGLASVAAKNLNHLSPLVDTREPELEEETQTCYPHSCRWKPYSSSNENGANAAVIIVILFCLLLCATCLGAAIRCFLRKVQSTAHPLTGQDTDQQKPGINGAAPQLLVVPTLRYSQGMNLAGAEKECTICLSLFEEGEEVKVITRCNHGFHVRCIDQWLSSHFSCPVCRRDVLPKP